MVLDTQKSLLTYFWNLLTTDPTLKSLMSDDVRCYLVWATPDAEFPYLVHRIDVTREGPLYVIQKATYYLDIWSHSPNANEALLIRKRLFELLDELVFSTDDVSRVHVETLSNGFIPESTDGIWHYATMWDIIFRRDAEADSMEGR